MFLSRAAISKNKAKALSGYMTRPVRAWTYPPGSGCATAPIVRIDTDKLSARRAMIRAMIAGRPGPRHQSKRTDELDVFIQASYRGRKDRAAATDENPFDLCCVLESQGNGITFVHGPSRLWVGLPLTHRDAPPPESGCAKRYATRSTDKGLVFKLRPAFRQPLGKGNKWGPVEKKRNPFLSALVESYRTLVTAEEKRVCVLHLR